MLAELENLFALQDKNYREFHARLMPNIEKERIKGACSWQQALFVGSKRETGL